MVTMFEKIWEAHEVGAEGSNLLYIDLHLVHEVTSPQAFDGLRLAGRSVRRPDRDRKSTRLNSSHRCISYAIFCLKKQIIAHADILWGYYTPGQIMPRVARIEAGRAVWESALSKSLGGAT